MLVFGQRKSNKAKPCLPHQQPGLVCCRRRRRRVLDKQTPSPMGIPKRPRVCMYKLRYVSRPLFGTRFTLASRLPMKSLITIELMAHTYTHTSTFNHIAQRDPFLVCAAKYGKIGGKKTKTSSPSSPGGLAFGPHRCS